MDSTEQSVAFFKKCRQEDPSVSVALTAIRTLIELIRVTEAATLSELRDTLRNVINQITLQAERNVTSVTSGCELFLRFITLASLDNDLEGVKRVLVERGQMFLGRAESARKTIASISQHFIRDGSVLLLHSSSKVVLQILREAAKQNKHFTVYITESHPEKEGLDMHRSLVEANIPSTVIIDSAVGYIMERVDMVLLGAEAVVESGGIINRIGTCQMAVMAKALNKPVYAAAESFKFLREYPLNQKQVTNNHKYMDDEATAGHPNVDYTPPSYIALLFTDLGILTPSAVSDELIKLYL